MRRRSPRPALLLAVSLVVLPALPACGSLPKPVRDAVRLGPDEPPFVHPYLADWEVVEVAPNSVEGRAPVSFREQLREGLYRALLRRNYSPLAPAFIDSDPGSAAQASQLRAGIEDLRIQGDGAVVATAWVALVAPRSRGGETLYLSQVTEETVAQPGQSPEAAVTIAGRGLAERLLRALPGR